MDIASYDKYVLTDSKEADLWNDCYFVFDASALLDFYSYPQATRNKINSDIFDKIKDRLWIPAHVQYEYLKNRVKVIRKPISELYDPLITTHIKPISDYLDATNKLVKELADRTKK